MGDTSPSPRQLFVEAIVFWSIGVILYVGRMYVFCHAKPHETSLMIHKDIANNCGRINQTLILYGISTRFNVLELDH